MTQQPRLADVRFVTVAEVALLMRVSKMTVYVAVMATREAVFPFHGLDIWFD